MYLDAGCSRHHPVDSRAGKRPSPVSQLEEFVRTWQKRSAAVCPIIFPWFGARADGLPGPAHGFARTTEWAIEATELLDDGRVRITLMLSPTDATHTLFSANFMRCAIASQSGRNSKWSSRLRNHGSEPVYV